MLAALYLWLLEKNRRLDACAADVARLKAHDPATLGVLRGLSFWRGVVVGIIIGVLAVLAYETW